MAYARSAVRDHHDHRFRDVSCNLSANGKEPAPQIISLFLSFSVEISLSGSTYSLPSTATSTPCNEKTTTPYFPRRSLKDVDEAEEKVVPVREMFCSWIIIPRHNGIGYNITDDIMWLGDSSTAGNQFSTRLLSRSPLPDPRNSVDIPSWNYQGWANRKILRFRNRMLRLRNLSIFR